MRSKLQSRNSKYLLAAFICLFSMLAVTAQRTVPYFGRINWISGYARTISGEPINYISAFPDYAAVALLTRATDGKKTIEWETAAVPTDLKDPYVYFSWVASHSSGTSADARNFDLYLNDKKILTLTTLPGNQTPDWTAVAPDSTRFVFQQTTRDHNEDAHGLAFLRVPASMLTPGQPARLKLIGQSQHSNDWFMTFKFSFAEQIDLVPSPFLFRNGMQAIIMNTLHFGETQPLEVLINDKSAKNLQLEDGLHTFSLDVPAVQKTDSVRVTIRSGNKILQDRMLTMQPVKQRTIYILPHSHFDVGYTEIQTNIEKKQLNNLLTGMQYAEQTKDYPEGAKYVWNLEGTYAIDLLNERGTEAQKKQFAEAVKRGQVSINGMFLNTLTGICKPEELLQLFRRAALTAKQLGVKIDAVMISDVPGYTWGVVTAMAKAGIKYFSPAPNNFDRIGTILQQMEEKPFYWVSPSGKEKVLVWIPYQGYSLSHGIPHLNAKFVNMYMNKLEEIKFPYDISYMRWSGHGDNAIPEIEVSEFVKEWNETYAWPHFIVSGTSEAFSAFEKKFGGKLPSYKGDWTGYWEDGAGSSAYETAENRTTSSRLTQAETMYALNPKTPYPVEKFYKAWQHVLLYSEHTWGADESVASPLSKKTTEQWEIKKMYADDASQLSKELLKDAVVTPSMSKELYNGVVVARSNNNAIRVFNTHSWVHSGLVAVPWELSTAGDVVKDEKGIVIPTQRRVSGSLLFIAKDVPPFGSVRYTIEKGDTPKMQPVGISKTGLDNGIIHVLVDTVNGGIISVRKKGIENEFADLSKGKLNEFLFLDSNKVNELGHNGPVQISVLEQGPVLSTLRITSQAPGCSLFRTDLTMLTGMDFVVIVNTVDKKPSPLSPKPGDYRFANLGGKEAINFGFPFKVPGGNITLDLPLGQMQPEKDQIPGSCKNWLEVNDWADVSNKEIGITLATPHAPLIQVGGITADKLGGQTDPSVWRKTIEPTQALYSWALNNHWETNYRASQEGFIDWVFALQPHGVFDPVKATQFAREFSEYLVVTADEGRKDNSSLVKLSSDRIVVNMLKPSDDGKGWIIALYNPSKAAASTTLKWNQPVKSMHYCNTGEEAGQPAPSVLTLAPLEVVLLRIEK